jgi:WD40 repeat protein
VVETQATINPAAGDIAQIACVPEAELLAAADIHGALALFSTSDATRLDYKPECCRRLVTALYAQPGLVRSCSLATIPVQNFVQCLPTVCDAMCLIQLVSGDAGGEIRVWNISEASLVPILSLSTPGRVTAALVTQIAQTKGPAKGSWQVVAGTDQGDVFVWDVDMGNVSEPWEPHTTDVLQVGMLSLSNTAITQLQDIPAGDSHHTSVLVLCLQVVPT